MAKHTATSIKNWDVQSSSDGKSWKPARCINHQYDSMWLRIKLAWGVLIGKYDALDWE